jgi:hypothetical protein
MCAINGTNAILQKIAKVHLSKIVTSVANLMRCASNEQVPSKKETICGSPKSLDVWQWKEASSCQPLTHQLHTTLGERLYSQSQWTS